MNSVRIGIIGILVDRYGIGQAEGFLHFFEGWVIFLSCIAILFVLAKAMQWLSGDRRPLGEAIDLDFSGLGGQLARVADHRAVARRCRRGADDRGALRRLGARAAARSRAGGARPLQRSSRSRSAAGSGDAARCLANVEATLGADDYLTAFYRAPGEAEGVDLFLSFYRSQTKGNAIHSPEVCLPATGWEVAAIRPVEIALPGTRTGSDHAEPGDDPEGRSRSSSSTTGSRAAAGT